MELLVINHEDYFAKIVELQSILHQPCAKLL